ncbi:hypothetical protein [Actinacidiphila sp. ITFR-21]|uniref:hypothetical protein n=1 Tax=Actinacidiphila sp. ITFR-21 TaxID=3075199 RepID=UPI0028898569|nr:hypothetical protein [Streptomyces sp. ITFR-21]WNI20135.1 hypothetical protein RLT57_31850 [Streptomyces sp. ITFR-21]
MPETVLPIPARLDPVRDDHAWPFALVSGALSHVRLRVWPTKDRGPLVIATDLMLGAGLVNDAEALCRAVIREFGNDAVVVRHFPAWSMLAMDGEDKFEKLTLDEKGTAHSHSCTGEVLDALGPSVLGFPGDTPPTASEVGAAVVPTQSVHVARILAALLRLTDTRVIERRPDGYPTRHAPVTEADLRPLSHVKLGATALQGLAHFLGGANVNEFETAAGAKRDKKLAKIVERLQEQAWELAVLGDEMAAEHRERD